MTPSQPSSAVVQILGVYNADGGLRGELAYVVGHLLGRVSCELCDITHSPVRRKRSWDRFVADFPIPITVVHRNEVPTTMMEAVVKDDLPALYAVRTDRSVDLLVDRHDLAALGGSVAELEQMLRARTGS